MFVSPSTLLLLICAIVLLLARQERHTKGGVGRAREKESVYHYMCYCIGIYVCGCVFPSYVMQHLWVCTATSLQEVYIVGCCNSICVCGCVFLAFVMQHL